MRGTQTFQYHDYTLALQAFAMESSYYIIVY